MSTTVRGSGLTFESGRTFTVGGVTTHRISQLAERSGVPVTTLRFYEDAGLLPADRTPSGYRVYGEGAVERLAFISSAKLLGLALEEIRELLGVREERVCASVRARSAPARPPPGGRHSTKERYGCRSRDRRARSSG